LAVFAVLAGNHRRSTSRFGAGIVAAEGSGGRKNSQMLAVRPLFFAVIESIAKAALRDNSFSAPFGDIRMRNSIKTTPFVNYTNMIISFSDIRFRVAKRPLLLSAGSPRKSLLPTPPSTARPAKSVQILKPAHFK
jgi:hypothetical protein